MSIHRSVLCVLALFVAMPAEAIEIKTPSGKIIVKRVGKSQSYRVIAVVGDDSTTNQVEKVDVSLSSDAGDDDVTLVEADAYLHGAATIKALPKTDATLTLTLYDKGSASLMSFSGTLGTDGAVALTADAVKDTSTDCALKTGCTNDTSATALDIEVLAGEVFAASGGYEIAVDLAGADTYEVAYATFVVTESTEVTTCDKSKVCTTTGSSTTTKAEVGWDEIGAVWEGELSVEPEGVIGVKVKTYDAKGEDLESTKVELGVPWIDGGEGINVLAVDEDPLTGVALMRRGGTLKPKKDSVVYSSTSDLVVVNSSGWTSTTVPVSAKVELTDGDTITIPVNSYQRVAKDDRNMEIEYIHFSFDKTAPTVNIAGGSVVFVNDGFTTLTDSPVCASGACFMLVENEDGDYELSVSEYGTDAAKLADELELTVTITDETGDKLYSETGTVEFDDDITAVFANEVGFSEDPIGLDLSGEVSLLGAGDSKGKQKTLAKGKFYGSFVRDGDGDLTLAGAEKSDIEAKGDILIGGEPIDIELTTDDNQDGVLNAPPITPVLGKQPGGKKGKNSHMWSIEENKGA